MKQLLAFVSLAFLFSFNTAEAAPLCSAVFNAEISAQEITATVKSLARMKLEVDLATAEGRESLELGNLKEQFPIKMAELTRALDSKLSEAEIHQLIAKEIYKLQKEQAREKSKEREARETSRPLLLNYVLKERIPVKGIDQEAFFKYIPDTHSILFKRKGTNWKLARYDLVKKKSTTLYSEPFHAAILHPNGKDVIIHTHNNEIVLFHLKGRKAEVLLTLPQGTGPSISLDPTGQVLFVSSESAFIAYDLMQNKTILNREPGFRESITALSPTQVGLASANSRHSVFDITDGSRTSFGPYSKTPYIYRINDHAVIETRARLEFYSLKDLSKPVNISVELSRDQRIVQKTYFDGQNFFTGEVHDQSYSFALYSFNDMVTPMFVFKGYGMEGDAITRVQDHDVSPDGKTVIIHGGEAPDGLKFKDFIEIWEIEK